MLIKNNKKTTVVSHKTAVRRAQKGQPSMTAMVKESWKESRPEAVAKARKLLKDPNYPSPKVLNSVAKLLARHLT